MKENDVIIIGGGLAGLFAAITAARRDRRVLLFARGVGSIAIGGGTIDMLGYDTGGVPVRNPIAAIETLGVEHPYIQIGREAVEASVQLFLDICREGGYPYQGSLTENRWIPTALGRLKPTCLTPMTMDTVELKDAETVFVAGFDGLKDYSPRVLAEGLSQCPGYRKNYSAIFLKTDLDTGRDLTALDVARWLDTPKGLESCLSQITESIPPRSMILMPPVLGAKPSYDVFNKIEQVTQCRVIETIGLPPAVTGYRLRRLLLTCLRKLNVSIIEQAQVIRAMVSEGRCHGIVTGNLDRERSYQAQSYILATGGFFGGGLLAEAGQVTEQIFNLPVQIPKQRSEWSKEHLFFTSGQPFAKFGVKVDETLRPVDSAGRVLLENVFVVGKALADYDYCTEKSGNGVALATAYRAGLEA